MSLSATRTVTLSVALLLATTSLSHAGFIWLSPDTKSEPAGTYSQQAEPVVPEGSPTELQGRGWVVDPSVPVAGATPAPAPGTLGTLPVETAPVGLSGTAPVVESNAISSQPVYAPGDQTSAPVEMVAAPPASAPAGEVTLATTRDMPLPAPVMQQGTSSASAMPSAEAMISSMPSMTAPRVAPAAPQPVMAPVEIAATTPAPAPVAAADAPVVPMLSPATVPMASAPAATQPAVSMVTGQSMETAAAAPVAGSDKVIDGFGKHVPLVIAMRQILPSGYGFAHGSGVDLSAAVDWQGGRPWPQVLTDAIRPIGLTATITGDTVMLEKGQAAMAPELTPPAPANVLVPVTSPSAPVAPGQAVLTNATVMQAPPSNN